MSIDHKAEAPQGKALDAEDHRLHALRLIEQAGAEVPNNAVEADYTARLAIPHALLAIAEGQERVAEEIKAFRELMGRSAT